MPTIHVRIRGRVQGVGFRYFTQQQATSLGVGGNVRNLADGSVEVEASGERVALERFVSALECGPDTGRVDECSIDWDDGGLSHDTFRVRP
ncbi:MAG: acylphosphatase [Gemmatimonadetes bacterium]|jgi:acylphosphatase|nr:acylphosphatase [Gemmatimonadota bacterium]MBT4613298.1 acylphosphatase [Gemmatimonadota bacterium]MBT5056640.1 acylphosphatase [Gemmatimonadota bacterium]MBT5141933.1 acylphosphatase [Gemmatimonadota bacterium]MBT5589777.1 acylphosphatase [Gemmatimonadota bacterium]